MNIKKYLKSFLMIGIIALILIISYFFQPTTKPDEHKTKQDVSSVQSETETPDMVVESFTENNYNSKKEQLKTPPKTETKNEVEEIKKENVGDDGNLTCSILVRCDTILKNPDFINKETNKFIPKDGVIYKADNVIFYEGESAFNVLSRELKKSKIHFEFNITPIYNTAYIEGIANIYEFDFGDLSGWMYKINGEVLSVGSSLYSVKNGDKIEFIYTCNMGKDI